MESLVAHWITTYGSLALFGLLVLGVFGAPVPDETLLVLAGALVGKHQLGAASTYGAAFLGSVVGITLSYTVGRMAGGGIIARYGALIHVTPLRLETARRWFERQGKWALFFGYFVPGVRHLTAIIAGTSNVAPSIFAGFAYGGALLWSASFISLGYYVGEQWAEIVGAVHHRLLVAFGVVMIVFIVYVAVTRLRRAAGTGRER